MKWLPKIFERAIHKGRLTAVGPDGSERLFGGKGPGPDVRIRFTDPSLDWKIFLNPELRATEAIMDGRLVIEKGSIHDFIELFFMNKRQFDLTPTQIFWNGLSRKFRRLMQNNDLRRAKRRVAHHYDLGNDFYRLWLDADMQYSCGYFPQGDETLEAAQLAKKRHIASKMALQPGQTVLDIGSGWGGMAIYLAKVADVHVTGVTLSTEQLEVAQERARTEGVADRVEFRLQDYREITETFDRIVSVGMLEHVGVNYLDRYFLDVRDRLAPEGVALIHSISSKAPPGITGPFLRKYIFPGGYAPSMSEAFASVERSGLWTLDCEMWRLHYAETLRLWRERFYACREKVVDMYDERFARMWEIYLSASECAFRYGSSCVFQMQLGRTRDAVPISRDYMIDVERRLAEAEQARLLAKTA